MRINFLKKLQNSGFVIYLMGFSNKSQEELDDMGINIISLKIDRKGKNIFKEINLLISIYKIIKKVKPDVILNFTIKPVIYCGLLNNFFNIPIISNMTGVGPYFFEKGFFNFFIKKLFKFSQKSVNKIFFHNKDDNDFFIKNYLVKEDRSFVIPGFGVDKNYFGVAPYPKNKEIIFILISRMLWNKGILEYVEAAKKIKKINFNVSFQLLGPIDKENDHYIPREKIDLWCQDKTIDYLGETDDVRPYILKSNCVVLPSYREGIPRILLQACSMCRPIITSNAPGCKDIVDNNSNGYICNVRDVDDLEDKFNNFLNLNIVEKEQMGLKARSLIEKKFDENIVNDKYLKEIGQILKKKI